MTYTSKLGKGLLGATALTLLSTGTAFAQNNFTPADTTVSNEFTLNYSVDGTPQPPIDNSPNPTTFKVDRLVNVTVTSNGDNTVAPNETNATLEYTVTNDGNDTHAYFLGIEEVVNGTGDDNLDTDAPTNGLTIQYSINGGAVTTYNAATPPVLAPDDVMVVTVTQDIPAGATDGDQADVILFADTRNNVAGFPATIADNNTTNSTNVTENVLADADGPGNATNDGVTDGAHSALGSYNINSADLTATKDVFVLDADYDYTCDAIPGTYTPPAAAVRETDGSILAGNEVTNNGYHRPGACVEYFITVTNDGTATATGINLADILPDNLIFESAAVVGGLTGGTLSTIAADTACDGTAATCNQTLTGATLAGKATPTDAPVVGHLVIRATIQ